MSDVEDELLALAGGGGSSDESDREDSHHEAAARKSPSSSPEPPPPSTSRRAATPPKRAAAPQKKAKRRPRDASEDEGEASPPPTPESQKSASMDESDSDASSTAPVRTAGASRRADADSDNGTTKYPVEGLFASRSERDHIMEMREVEREQILAERRDEIERERQNRLLRQLVNSKQGGDASGADADRQSLQPGGDDDRSAAAGGSALKKRKASAAELEGEGGEAAGQRKTTRQRTKVGGGKVGETSAGIDSLRRARAEKSDRLRRREEDARAARDGTKLSPTTARRSGGYGYGDGDSADESDEIEWAAAGTTPNRRKGGARRSRSPEPAKETPVAELRNVEHARLGRSTFSKICFFPGFAEAVIDCFVRVNIGPDAITGLDVYRVGLIKGIAKSRPYALEGRDGQHFVTDQYVTVAHGKAVRDWPFIFCSNSPFTEAEWARYKIVCEAENVALPKVPALAKKVDDIDRLFKRTWTEAELQAKLDRQEAFRRQFTPPNKEVLRRQMDEARRNGDEARAAELQDRIDTADVPRLAWRTTLNPSPAKARAPAASSSSGAGNGAQGGGATGGGGTPSSSGKTQQERLAEINQSNRRANQEAVRRAQLKERHQVRKIEAAVARGEQVAEDPSRRLRTKAKFVHDVKEEAPGTPGSSSQSQPKAAGADKDKAKDANGTPKLGATAPNGGVAQLPHLLKLQQANRDKNGLPTFHKPLMDDDIIGALDLDIDVDIDV